MAGTFLPNARGLRVERSTWLPVAAGRWRLSRSSKRGTVDAAAWALDEYRLRRVAVAAQRLAPRYARDGDDIRIDALFIVPGRLPRHMANVWIG